MFFLIRLIISIAGIIAIAYFVLPYFGYGLNLNYFKESRSACQENLRQCQKDLIDTGVEGAKKTCDWKCVDPKLIIRKQDGKGDIIDSDQELNPVQP